MASLGFCDWAMDERGPMFNVRKAWRRGMEFLGTDAANLLSTSQTVWRSEINSMRSIPRDWRSSCIPVTSDDLSAKKTECSLG